MSPKNQLCDRACHVASINAVQAIIPSGHAPWPRCNRWIAAQVMCGMKGSASLQHILRAQVPHTYADEVFPISAQAVAAGTWVVTVTVLVGVPVIT